MNHKKLRAAATNLAKSLFVNGAGEIAERLVLWQDGNKRDLGGLCWHAVRDRIVDVNASTPAEKGKGAK